MPHHYPHRSFGTGLSSIPPTSQSISNPSILPHRTIDRTAPSSTATSSHYTLDHPFWFDRPDPAISALTHATDDELFKSLLLPTTRRGKSKGKQRQNDWLGDPRLSFLALRSRPTYTAFLQSIHPFLNTVYDRLKKAGQHELLISDLLLRHPDPRLLRDLLEIEFRLPTRSPSSFGSNTNQSRLTIAEQEDQLRGSLVTTIYSTIEKSLANRKLEALNYRTLIAVCRAYTARQDIPSLIQAWHTLRLACPSDDKETAYLLLSFVAFVSSRTLSDSPIAFGMLHSLIKDEMLPSGIFLRDLGNHPRRREILILGAVVRSCLYWKLDIKAREHAGELLSVVLDGVTPARQGKEALELVLEVCRVAEGTKALKGLSWCTDMFFKMATTPKGPEIPAPLFDAWLEAVFNLPRDPRGSTKSYALDIWVALPAHRRPRISATNILHLAGSTRDISPLTLHGIVRQLDYLDPSTTLHIAEPLILVISSLDMPKESRRPLYNILLKHWSGNLLNLDGKELVSLVKDLRADRPRCTAIVQVYEARLVGEYERRGEIQISEALAMVHTHLLVKGREGAEGWLEGLELTDEVKLALWEMGLGNGYAKTALRGFLRKRLNASEVKKILAGDLARR